MDINTKTKTIISELNKKLIEREHVVPSILLAIFSRSHMLLLGPPGTGKSLAIDLATYFIDDIKTFSYTVGPDTSLEELFGTKIVNDKGHFEYNNENSMLDSHLVVLDELYKGPSDVHNALLDITHPSRTYYQRGRGKLVSPMLAMFASSNELPNDNKAEAFDDRLPFRFFIEDIKKHDNIKRFNLRQYDRTKDFSVRLSLEEVKDIYSLSQRIILDESVMETYIQIKQSLGNEKVRVSDRKSDIAITILQVSAYVNLRDRIDFSDLFILLNVIWLGFNDVDRVESVIFDSVFGNKSAIFEHLKSYKDTFMYITAQTKSNVSNVFSHRYNFNGTDAQNEFSTFYSMIEKINTQLVNLAGSCNALRDNYLASIEIEKEIERNIFLPIYKNHIYARNDTVGEKRVNKDEIFDLIAQVNQLNKTVSSWLQNNKNLFEYNNNKIQKSA